MYGGDTIFEDQRLHTWVAEHVFRPLAGALNVNPKTLCWLLVGLAVGGITYATCRALRREKRVISEARFDSPGDE